MSPINLVLSRRHALAVVTAAVITPSLSALAQTRPPIVIHKDPNCGCCGAWAKHLERAGFPVTVVATATLPAVKQRLGVPGDLVSCHTAETEGYVIEGHVPVPAIVRLLAERPQATGLAVPGMPTGSPGMEGGAPEVYEVVLFAKDIRRSFGHYKGTELV